MSRELKFAEDYIPLVGQALQGLLASMGQQIKTDDDLDTIGVLAVKVANATIKHADAHVDGQTKRKLNDVGT